MHHIRIQYKFEYNVYCIQIFQYNTNSNTVHSLFECSNAVHAVFEYSIPSHHFNMELLLHERILIVVVQIHT